MKVTTPAQQDRDLKKDRFYTFHRDVYKLQNFHSLGYLVRMSYQLFLDDLRTVQMVYPTKKENDFIIVRSYEDFVKTVLSRGLPHYISFDNDLGEDPSGNVLPDGYAAAKWLVYESGLDLKNLEFYVHSANPVAREQIQALLDNYIAYLRKQ